MKFADHDRRPARGEMEPIQPNKSARDAHSIAEAARLLEVPPAAVHRLIARKILARLPGTLRIPNVQVRRLSATLGDGVTATFASPATNPIAPVSPGGETPETGPLSRIAELPEG